MMSSLKNRVTSLCSTTQSRAHPLCARVTSCKIRTTVREQFAYFKLSFSFLHLDYYKTLYSATIYIRYCLTTFAVEGGGEGNLKKIVIHSD